LTAKAGEPVRFYFVDAGPNRFSAFHVIGTIFDKVMPDGNPANAMYGVQTVTVPPGGAVIADLVADTGTYPILTHVMKDASTGALGLLKVGAPAGEHDPGNHGGGTPAPAPTPTPAPTPAPSPAPAPAEGNTIRLNNFAYVPALLKVKAGTTVTWINQEDTDHSVVDTDAKTPAERLFDSTGEKEGKPIQYMKRGDTFSFTFTTPGTYHFKCRQHPFMTGTIVVE
ncbi:MAG TPA: plastocyanin/azurin family copper-binding protein, partial [Symbiobacteriaceae bacterium]|nr:plastocyanin/azurin family copper-binding protein [Symbiobacteriaceae bacterium]